MDKREYEASFLLENDYWWFKGQRAIILDQLRAVLPFGKPIILDAGCGTGKNLEALREALPAESFGFDLSSDAIPFLRRRNLHPYVAQASINSIPFANSAFDAVVSLGVLECEEVDETSGFNALWRVVKPGGTIILVVSAYDWLLAPHDIPIHAVRRYNRRSIQQIFKEKPAIIKRMTYLYPTLFPMVATSRLLSRWRQRSNSKPETSDLKPIPTWLNRILVIIVGIERMILRRVNFSFGSSLLVVLQKPLGAEVRSQSGE